MFEWREAIWLAVSALVTAMLITLVITLGAVSKEAAKIQQADLDADAQMQEIRNWVRYDNTLVDSGEVISCITNNKEGIPAIIVDRTLSLDKPLSNFDFDTRELKNKSWNLANTSYLWSGAKANENLNIDYTYDALNEFIPPQTRYRSHISKDSNGVVKYIGFRRVPMWTAYENVKISGAELKDCIKESRYQKVEFLITYINSENNEITAGWNEFDVRDDYLNNITKDISDAGLYSAIIHRNQEGKVKYIHFKRIA